MRGLFVYKRPHQGDINNRKIEKDEAATRCDTGAPPVRMTITGTGFETTISPIPGHYHTPDPQDVDAVLRWRKPIRAAWMGFK
ncbi:hypothetical protein AA15669_1350 [Saccharibacter floricola DSM 15669]|uniref:Uncharacterized protein n=1 Tax=Saccharibacter floricola DSM 15669 TaxID=1123227 RepID=A0ABQ0P2X5_9PROT|nr:hypothetical protein AA15669_1350 [Saccharibacter floricola DSM 15669]